MRRGICFLMVLPVLLGAVPAAAAGEEGFDLGCTAAVLMERQTGTVLYAKGEHERLAPASVTKVMTLLLIAEAVDSGAVSPDDIVTAGPRAASMGGSQVWLKEGERMTVAEMTKCIAVASANDCAVAMAEHLCGSEAAFTERMNQRAAELGMADTHFTNCTGLFEDPDHYTSAYDVALMSRELLGYPFVRQFTGLWTDSIRGGAFGLTNTNRLVRFYPGCTGLKTGFTTRAMFCLAASAMREDTEFIAVVLHGETSQKRFDAARTLLDYAFANYALLRPDESVLPRVRVRLGTADSVGVRCADSGLIVADKRLRSRLETAAELPGEIQAPVAEGQRLGTLRLTADGEVISETPLVAEADVLRKGPGRIWLELVEALCGEK